MLALVLLVLSSCAQPPAETSMPSPELTPTTIGIETKNLRIYYPDFIDEKDAREQARILQEAYDFYYDLIGQEYPFNGRKIEIIFDSSRGNTSSSGNPIIMGLDSGIFDGRILPPEPAFFHEIVHNFTMGARTSVAKYVDINGSIEEAFADLFTYYFRHERLKYSNSEVTSWLNKLKEYESKQTDPYSLDWGAHKDAQPYMSSILFYISEKYGWDVWNRFFRVARISDIDGIPLNKRGSFIDLRRTEDAIVFGDFVYILSVASGENLIPTFENWGFHFEKQIKEKTSQWFEVLAPTQPLLEYTVTVNNPETHLANVSLTMSNFSENQIRLSLRTIADYDEPFIKQVAIVSKQGRILSGPLFERGEWSVVVDTERATSITLDYDVEQLIPDPHGDYESYIGQDFAVIDASTLFLYPKNAKAKSLVRFVGPEGWTASSVWEEAGSNLFSFVSSSELDNFVAFGPFNTRTEKIGNLKAILCVYRGVESSVDVEETFKVIEDLTGYYSQAFKPLDKKALLWIVVSSPITGGGVREGAFLMSAVRTGASFWGKLAHEYAHQWNGRGLLYTQQARWFNEGATEFLTYKALTNIGAITKEVRDDKLLRNWRIYLDLRKSNKDKAVSAGTLADVSIIYTKGHLVNYALDLMIQDITEGGKDFLDVTRYLAENYWGDRLSNDDLLKAVNHVTGADLSDFFSKYVYGTEKLPLQIMDGTLVLKK